MADEKVIIQLVLDDKDFKKVANAIPDKFNDTGKKAGNSFSKGFKSGLSKFNNILTKPFALLKSKFLALGASIAGGLLFKKSIEEANKLETSLLGLQSVTASFGADVDGITSAAKNLAADGLIPLSDVTSSLKNLMLNFDGDMEKSISTFKSFRDAAAFGRQGSLSLGEAIVGASEGLKNDLSIKVDNAGVTRNLSLMNKDYAKTIGTTVGKLTEAQKAEAEYLGVKKEASRFQGDYNKLLNTFSGAQSKVAGSTRFLLAELGSIITKSPLVVKSMNDQADSIQKITKQIKDFAAGGGLKRVLLSLVEVGKGVVKWVITPIEFIVDVLIIVQKAINTWASGVIAIWAKVGSAISKVLNLVGVDNDFTKFFQDFEETSFSVFKENLAKLKTSMDDAFGFEQSEKITVFFDSMEASIMAGGPALDTLSSKIDNSKKKMGELADSSNKSGKAIANSVNNLMVKSASTGIQALTKSLLLGEKGFANFGKVIAGMMGDMAIQLGETLLLTGIGMAALGDLSPGAAIAAGAGLIALGTILKSFSGGGETSPSAGTVGGNFATDQTTGIEDGPVEREEQVPGININIRGDVLDTTESGMRIVDIINKAYDQEGVVINRGAIA